MSELEMSALPAAGFNARRTQRASATECPDNVGIV